MWRTMDIRELKTPNLDELASAALRFDCFYAAAPVCSAYAGQRNDGTQPESLWLLQVGFYTATTGSDNR